jgi:membrane fusion protein, copper/silver efflux system
MNNKSRWIPWLIVIVLISLGLNAFFLSRHRAGSAPSASISADLYVCPMHPQVRQDHPGDCPICAMKLVKQQPGVSSASAVDSTTLYLSPSQEILANVRTERPREESFSAARSIPGRIIPKEDSQWKISARVMGRIEKLHVATPGQAVKRGAPLFDLFSPDLANAQREWLLARDIGDEQTRTALLTAAQSKLLSLGMEPGQIGAFEKSGEIQQTLTFHATQPGVLMDKMISPGEWVMPGMVVLEFTDLSEVWAEGAVYEQDMAYIHLGDSVQIVTADGSLSAPGKIDFISPMLDMMTRTLSVRASLNNPEFRWKSDMYVRVEWAGQNARKALSVADDAVLSTGHYNRVWVKVSEGHFRPHDVIVGPRQQGRVAIINGLTPTDEVVVSGGYLIDSDAQLKSLSIPSAPVDSVISEPAPVIKTPAKLKRAPSATSADTYICTMCPEVHSDKPGRCPTCGMNLVKKAG